MRRPHPQRLHPARWARRRLERAAAGLTLVELMIATLIVAIVTAGSLGMVAIASRQANLSRKLQEEEFAIRLDLAAVQSINDRFTCASGICQIDNAGAPPGQNEYYPSTAAAQATFTTLCSQGALSVVPSSGYGSGVVSLIQGTAPPPSFQALGISRSVSVDTGTPAAHRYTVSWTGSNGSMLRQISLSPTAAAWCP